MSKSRSNLDYDDPAVQKEIFETVSLLCYRNNMPIAGNFLQSQAFFAATEVYLQNEAEIELQEVLRRQDVEIDNWSGKVA